MTKDIKASLVRRLRQIGAYDVRVADPQRGFEKALPGKHPLELWNECVSVIVFAVAMAPLTNNFYLGPYAPWENKKRDIGPVPADIQSGYHAMDRLSRLFRSSISFKGMQFLSENGFAVSFARTQEKLCAFESGLGVYGRSGLILHPDLGNRMCIGVIMTNAKLDPDNRLEGFEPCADCDCCIRMCPANAFDPGKNYPESWSRERCTKKRAEIDKEGLYCHNCFAVCPAGSIPDDDLLSSKNAETFYR